MAFLKELKLIEKSLLKPSPPKIWKPHIRGLKWHIGCFCVTTTFRIFEVKVRSPNFILFLLIKWAIFKDFWFWPQIFLKVVVTKKQPLCHFKPLIWGFQILGILGFSKLFSIIFSCFKNAILLYVYYMGYVIIWSTL